MDPRTPLMINASRDEPAMRHDAEIEWMLDAIVGAIVTGRLPPDDACAWARIAMHEVGALTMDLPTAAGGCAHG